jgi:hypothetical protein
MVEKLAKNIILVEQYKYPANQINYEIPVKKMIMVKHMSLERIVRELEKEIRYIAGKPLFGILL